jgi:outer membrane lipoprotein-sorting protein
MKTNNRLTLGLALVVSFGALAAGAHAAGTPLSVATGTPRAAADAPVLPRLTVQEIVAKNVAARGGLAAWRAIKSISYDGSLDAGKVRPDNGLHPSATERLIEKPGTSRKVAQAPDQKLLGEDTGTVVTLPYTLIMQRPNKQRVEVKFKDQTLVQVYDGEHGWKLQPYLNRGGAIAFTAEELKKARQFQDIDGPLIDYVAKGIKIQLDGVGRVEGRPSYVLKLELQDGSTRRVWVDAETYLDVQVDGSRRLNGRVVPVYTTLRDFRTVMGIKVPYLMETRTEGLPDREKIIVDKVVLNPKLDGHFFTKPS